MRTDLESPDLDVTSTQRQIAAQGEQVLEQFVSLRTVAGTADASFSFGPRASRPSSGATGDRYYADDFGTYGGVLYVYNGTAWEVLVGFVEGTDAQRSGYTPNATDNGFFFFTNDATKGKLWVVAGGSWTDLFVVLDLTTALRIGGNQVIGVRKTGWGAPAGTLSRAAYTAYAGQDVSAAYVETEAQQTDDAVKLLAQVVAALLTDIHTSTSAAGGHKLLST